MKKWKELTEQEKKDRVLFLLGWGSGVVGCAIAWNLIDKYEKKHFDRVWIDVMPTATFDEVLIGIGHHNHKSGKHSNSCKVWGCWPNEYAKEIGQAILDTVSESEKVLSQNNFNNAIEAATDAIKKEVK